MTDRIDESVFGRFSRIERMGNNRIAKRVYVCRELSVNHMVSQPQALDWFSE